MNYKELKTIIQTHNQAYYDLSAPTVSDGEYDQLYDKLEAMEKAQGELQRVVGKLANEKFVSNAPEAVIAKEKAKQAEFEQSLAKLKEQYAEIEAI